MREHETSAPSLGANPSDGALKVARQNGGEDGELVERIAWMLEPEAFQIWEREYQAKSGAKMRGPTWDQLAVSGRREKARETAASIVAGPLAGRLIDPIAMAEAVASARAEGWKPIETAPKDGTEVDLFTSTNRRFVDLYWDREQRGGGWAFYADRNQHWMDRRTIPCSFVTHWRLPPAPPTLIPGGSSDV